MFSTVLQRKYWTPITLLLLWIKSPKQHLILSCLEVKCFMEIVLSTQGMQKVGLCSELLWINLYLCSCAQCLDIFLGQFFFVVVVVFFFKLIFPLMLTWTVQSNQIHESYQQMHTSVREIEVNGKGRSNVLNVSAVVIVAFNHS